MELYQAFTDYHGMMDLTENMFRYVAESKWQCSCKIWRRRNRFKQTVQAHHNGRLRKKYAGIDWNEVKTDEKKACKGHHIEFEDRHRKGDILSMFFDTYCEGKAYQPTFVMDHPIEFRLGQKKPRESTRYVERFELFITVGRCAMPQNLMILLTSADAQGTGSTFSSR